MAVKKWLLLPFIGSSEGKREPYHPKNDRRQYSGDQQLEKHESAADYSTKSEEDIVHDYNAPTRWWVVSTLFPLIAGTFGPMASAFNICAVSIPWRLIVSPSNAESEGTHIPDHAWLITVNAVSLGVAIVANLFLLGQMTNRIPFKVAMPTVIVGWYISGILDIALVAAAPRFEPLPPNSFATWSQAYYYAAFSGALYVMLSSMLMLTAAGVWVGHFSDQFKLTLAQRSLMAQTMCFLAYLLLSGAIYSAIEGWIFLDAVYYSVVTLFTIGFGDFVPTTHLGRSLFFPWTFCGDVFVGLIIGNIRSLVLESVSIKVSTRMVEKARYKAIMSGDPATGIVKIRGIHRRDVNGPNELERRRKEFECMQEIRVAAKQNNRFMVLTAAAIAFSLLWFVGGVIFWQGEKATGGQNWTYFESIYFTYVAALTIGYGDFEPQTNASKPAFVFWALLALPTLTVLIGAIGDSVSDSVNWAMVFFGKHAPKLFTLANGLKRNMNKEEALKAAIEGTHAPRRGLDENFADIADVEDGLMVPAGHSNNAFGEVSTDVVSDAYRPNMLAQAAQLVLEHFLSQVDGDSPRQYTYEEWAWLLNLLGEDEGSKDGHRKVGQPLAPGKEISEPVRENDSQVWSWMGQESPLMNLVDESEPRWVLQQLLVVLQKELKKAGDRRINEAKGCSGSCAGTTVDDTETPE